jgi:hypothetical protein
MRRVVRGFRLMVSQGLILSMNVVELLMKIMLVIEEGCMIIGGLLSLIILCDDGEEGFLIGIIFYFL